MTLSQMPPQGYVQAAFAAQDGLHYYANGPQFAFKGDTFALGTLTVTVVATDKPTMTVAIQVKSAEHDFGQTTINAGDTLVTATPPCSCNKCCDMCNASHVDEWPWVLRRRDFLPLFTKHAAFETN